MAGWWVGDKDGTKWRRKTLFPLCSPSLFISQDPPGLAVLPGHLSSPPSWCAYLSLCSSKKENWLIVYLGHPREFRHGWIQSQSRSSGHSSSYLSFLLPFLCWFESIADLLHVPRKVSCGSPKFCFLHSYYHHRKDHLTPVDFMQKSRGGL